MRATRSQEFGQEHLCWVRNKMGCLYPHSCAPGRPYSWLLQVKVRCPEGTKDPSHRVCICVCLCLSFCLCLLLPVSLHVHVGVSVSGDKKIMSSAFTRCCPFNFSLDRVSTGWSLPHKLNCLPGQQGPVGSTCLCLPNFTSGITSACHHPLYFLCLNVGPGG